MADNASVAPVLVSERDRESPTVLSTFTGAGGLDLGLECAGFRVVGCVEQDTTARETLAANRPNWPLLEPFDIVDLARELQLADLGIMPRELDLISGGPPCQSFSKAGQWSKNGRAGIDKNCAPVIDALLALIELLLPRAIFLENVPGFVRGNTNAIPYLEKFLHTLNGKAGTSYRLQWRLNNASDFGVPQRRQRAIIVAFRDGSSFEWPTPTHAGDPLCAWDALANVSPRNLPRATGKWADLLPSIPEGKNYIWLTNKGQGRELFGYRTRFWSFLLKLAKHEPAWTIPAHPGPATGPFHWDNRPLSCEELLRLQGFPPDWTIVGSYYHQVRQVGNATPPLIAELYGRAIYKHLYDRSYDEELQLAIPRQCSVPPPEPCAPVPGKYLVLERSYSAHPGPGLGPNPITPVRE